MRLRLTNGYPYPYPLVASEEEQEEINSSLTELEISGVVHFEWKHCVTVEFEDWLMHDKAMHETGWEPWSALVLEAPTSSGEGYDHPAIIADGRAYCGFILKG